MREKCLFLILRFKPYFPPQIIPVRAEKYETVASTIMKRNRIGGEELEGEEVAKCWFREKAKISRTMRCGRVIGASRGGGYLVMAAP